MKISRVRLQVEMGDSIPHGLMPGSAVCGSRARARNDETESENACTRVKRRARPKRTPGGRGRAEARAHIQNYSTQSYSVSSILARAQSTIKQHTKLKGQSKHQQSYKTRRDHDLCARQSAGSSTNRPHTHPMRQPAHPRSALWGRVRACPQVPRERALRSVLCVLTRRGARPPRRSTCSRACRHRAAASPARQQVSM